MSAPAAKTAPTVAEAKRSARLAAVQGLYQRHYRQLVDDGLHLDEGQSLTQPDLPLLRDIIRTAEERGTDIDSLLNGALDPEWALTRLEQVLRAVLQAGVAELLLGGPTPKNMLVSDYVDVAHAFFGGREPALVNAVLDRVAKALGQPS